MAAILLLLAASKSSKINSLFGTINGVLLITVQQLEGQGVAKVVGCLPEILSFLLMFFPMVAGSSQNCQAIPDATKLFQVDCNAWGKLWHQPENECFSK